MRPLVPLVSCATVVLAWELVAHNSGAGWVQAVGDVLAGILGVGLVAPAVACRRGRVHVVATPADATAGTPTALTVRATSRLRVTPLVPAGRESFVGPRLRARRSPVANGSAHHSDVAGRDNNSHGADGDVVIVAERRGVHDHVVLELASAAPFGLLWWRRDVTVALPRTLYVGPRMGEPLPLPRGIHDGVVGEASPVPALIGEHRAVRPYRPGDLRRFVHWPATAHSGELMVREMETHTAEPVTVEVRLPAEPDVAERMAEQALATVVTLVERGAPVLLATTEGDGARTETVGDRRSAGRRLARAVAEPGAPS